MKRHRNLSLFLLILACLLFLGLLFAPFLLTNVIQPAALAIWLLLRITILSIDQIYLWILLIVAGGIFAIRHLFPSQILEQVKEPLPSNPFFKQADLWRAEIRLGKSNPAERKIVQRELTNLLISLFNLKQQGDAYQEPINALQQAQVPLPDSLRAFLFPKPPKNKNQSSFQKTISSLRQAPVHWIYQWSGRETADYNHSIDEILTFLEDALEMNDDSNRTDIDEH